MPQLIPARNTSTFFQTGIVLFEAECQEKSRADVLNSVLLSSLATSKKCDKISDTKNWHQLFHQIIENIGWVIPNFDFSIYLLSKNRMLLSEILADISMKIGLKAKEMQLFNSLIQLSVNLEDEDDIFKTTFFSDASKEVIVLTVFICDDSSDNASFKALVVNIRSMQSTENIFWRFFSSSKTTIDYSFVTSVLNEDVYLKLRESIKQKVSTANPKTLQLELV